MTTIPEPKLPTTPPLSDSKAGWAQSWHKFFDDLKTGIIGARTLTGEHTATIADHETRIDALEAVTGTANVSVTLLTTGSGTYTVPAGVRALIVRMAGGGGAGGGVSAAGGPPTSPRAGGAGGSAGQCQLWIGNAYLAASYTYSIGAGGTGVSAGNGNAGASSTFVGGGIDVTCTGGGGGSENPTTTGTAAGGTVGTATVVVSAPATGFGDYREITGTAGVSSVSSLPLLGFGGGTIFAPSTPPQNGNGMAASANTGCGGSGGFTATGATARTGGAGGSGIIEITELY